MLNEPVVTAMLVLLFFVVGDFFSIITIAHILMLLVVAIGYFVLLWTVIIAIDMISSSTMSAFGAMMVSPLIVHMGTLVPFKLIKSQIRAVFIALMGIVFAALAILAVIPFIFD